MIGLGRVGIWTRQLDKQPGAIAQDTVAELESLGYPTLWIPEASEREVISHASLLLAATESIVIATGIARVHARSPQATALAQRFLAQLFPGRFLLGLGVSHPAVVERMLGQVYGRPLATMRSYLDAMEATPGGAPVEASTAPTVLAALGPKMLALAAERTAGAHTYSAPVAHTAWAREVLGPESLLAPAIKVVLTDDRTGGAAIARGALGAAPRLPAYRDNLLRSGFTEDDLTRDLSNRLVDALVAIGDVDTITDRIQEHLDAGADHVCVEVLTGDDTAMPLDEWRRLAPALTAFG